jgi:hypothetical protein
MTLQSEAFLDCPWCGEPISVVVDHSVPEQAYIEDCEVCCRPIALVCRIEADAEASVTASREG